MRHAATQALLERNDVVIVASVSCIYGIGSVETYAQDGGEAGDRRPDRPRRAGQGAGRAAIPPQRRRLPARHVPPARRDRRHLPEPLRGPRLARHAVRRRGRGDPRIRSADRREDRRAERDHRLRQQPLRHAAADADAGDPRHQGRAEGAAGGADRGGQAAGGGAAAAAHHVRHRDDGDHRLLQRHRELLALPDRPQSRRSAADAVRIPAGERAADRR